MSKATLRNWRRMAAHLKAGYEYHRQAEDMHRKSGNIPKALAIWTPATMAWCNMEIMQNKLVASCARVWQDAIYFVRG